MPRTTGRGTRLLAGFAIGVAACTSEHVTSVGVTSVTVEPASMNAVEGERHPLDAVVVDDLGEAVADAPVVWTSSDETVARVDADGVVEARKPGEVEIRATFRDAWGAATVRVLPRRAIGVSRDSVAMTAGSIGIDPPPEVVHVANTGVGALEGLTARVRYSDGAERAWLAAELGSSEAPTTLTLTADAAPLGVGVYRATVLLEAEGRDVEPVEIVVILRVRILSAGPFSALGETVSALREADSDHVAYINIYPNNAPLGRPGDADLRGTRGAVPASRQAVDPQL